jgi:hypothetical protein
MDPQSELAFPKRHDESADMSSMTDCVLTFTVICLSCVACHPLSGTRGDAWTGEWTLVSSGGEGGRLISDWGSAWHRGEMIPGKFGNRPNYDAERKRSGILELHPLSGNEPAKIRFKGNLRSDLPVLVVEAGGNIHGDCVLECRLDDRKVGAYVLNGSTWTTCAFDLTGMIHDGADLQVWNVAGGKDPWSFEHCYIDDIRFDPRH